MSSILGLDRALKQIMNMKDCSATLKDGSLSIKARTMKDLNLIKKMLDKAFDSATGIVSVSDKRKAIEAPLTIRWNQVHETSGGYKLSGNIAADVYKSGVTLKDNRFHHASEYGYRAFPLTVSFKSI